MSRRVTRCCAAAATASVTARAFHDAVDGILGLYATSFRRIVAAFRGACGMSDPEYADEDAESAADDAHVVVYVVDTVPAVLDSAACDGAADAEAAARRPFAHAASSTPSTG